MDQPTNPVPEKQIPEIPKDLWENKIPYQPPKASNPVWRWVWVTLVVVIVVGGVGYAGVRYWSTISNWFSRDGVTNNTTDNTVQTDSQIAWQTRESIGNLNLMLDVANSGPNNPAPNSLANYYKVGTFVGGLYKDGNLIIAELPPQNAMGGGLGYYYFAQKTDGQLILLTNHSPELYTQDGINRNKFTIDNSYRISSLFFPQTLKNPMTDNSLQALEAADITRNTSANGKYWFDEAMATEKWRKMFTDPAWGDVYTDPAPTEIFTIKNSTGPLSRYGFYLQAPDGTIRTYKLISDAVLSKYVNNTDQPYFAWADGSSSQDEYFMAEMGGCGATNLAAVMPDGLMNDLIVASEETSGAGVIYELKNTKHSLLQELYEEAKANPDNKGLTYASFLKAHPIFFWKDSFGRIIKFQNKRFMMQAECGKPVIYLYPEKTTKVSVKVEPQGGLSYSDPDYGKGWTVWADPSGKLTEIISGKVYPYLFWEGRGGLYQSPDKGWVVKQSEVSNFLDTKLSQFGLIDQEIADFKEFWLPRMQSAAYYKIGFWGNQEMNRLAPLTISPKPDTVIRILMDFTPLKQPAKVAGFSIVTPKRTGFTVVEWGGVIK